MAKDDSGAGTPRAGAPSAGKAAEPNFDALPEIVFPQQASALVVSDFVGAVRQALDQRGVALVTGARFGPPQLRALLATVADNRDPVHQGDRLAEIVRLAPVGPTTAQPASGMFPLPLHRDGALVGMPTNFIAFSAVHADPRDGVGVLELVDSANALTQFDSDLLDTLRSHAIEYRVLDRRPFPHLPVGWFTRPTFTHNRGREALNIVLPVATTPGWSNPWETRIGGLTPVDSAHALARIDTQLRASSTFASHRWNPGDVVLVDNSRVLHGVGAIPRGAAHMTIREAI